MKTKAEKSNGFTLAEALCALLCFSILVSLTAALMKSSLGISQSLEKQPSSFFVLQLRQFAALQDRAWVEQEQLHLFSANGEFVIFHDSKSRLVKTRTVPGAGYEILLENVQKAVFREESRKIYVEIEKDGWSKTWQIV